MDYENFFKNYIDSLQNEGRYRVFADLERLTGDAPYALRRNSDQVDKVVVWCSNDYLGMSHHPEVIQAMVEAAQKYGVGSGGTRNISGTMHSHVLLEEELASLHCKEKALIFTSGYSANETTIATLASNLPGCIVLSDEQNHASIIQGIKLGRTEKRIFKHNNIQDLQSHLANLDYNTPKIIVLTSVYSMDGDIVYLPEICELAKKYNAITYLDEVHAVGLFASDGAGVAASLGLQNQIDIIQGNFAKAYGVIGGYIAASKKCIDFVRSAAPGFIFTTSLPPGVAEAARKSVQILRQDTSPREQLWDRVAYLKNQLSKTNLPYKHSDSHIVPIVVGDAALCKSVTDKLLDNYKIYVQPINYPTVQRGQERLRLTVTPKHTHAMIDDLICALQEIWLELDLRQAA
jgi:5-aminolevulinate synthase